MARALHRLTARQVVTLKKIGRHADGGGLYLRITNAGARSWVFIATTNGKRSEIGLGAAATVSLAVARRIAADMRDAMAAGGDPRTVIAPVESAPPSSVPTFGIFAEEYIASVESGWRNPVHRQQWRQSLRDHASGLTALPIDSIGTDDVLAVLQPIWLTHAETASRVRGRIEKILDAAKVRGHRPRDAANPASWRGHLELLLPPRPKLQRGTMRHWLGKMRPRSSLPWSTGKPQQRSVCNSSSSQRPGAEKRWVRRGRKLTGMSRYGPYRRSG